MQLLGRSISRVTEQLFLNTIRKKFIRGEKYHEFKIK